MIECMIPGQTIANPVVVVCVHNEAQYRQSTLEQRTLQFELRTLQLVKAAHVTVVLRMLHFELRCT